MRGNYNLIILFVLILSLVSIANATLSCNLPDGSTVYAGENITCTYDGSNTAMIWRRDYPAGTNQNSYELGSSPYYGAGTYVLTIYYPGQGGFLPGSSGDINGIYITQLSGYTPMYRYSWASGLNPNAPVANFTMSNSSGITPLIVNFTDTTIGNNITNWNWSFNGTNFSTDQHPNYTFNGFGNYSVILNVSNASGYNITTKYVNVGVPNDTWYRVGNCFQLINESTNDTIVKCNTTGSYNWTLPANVTRIQYLVVAGGGGGGGGHTPIDGGSGGGGGAGGLLTGSISRITSIINITVGTGGAGGAPDTLGYAGTNGTNSILGNLTINYTSIGGGGGAGYGTLAKAGGSGGGGNGQNTGASANAASGTNGQGYRGGYGALVANYSSGGGGGSGGMGENGTASINGAGGIGLSNSLIGIATRYAAGGGGGGGNAFSGNTTGASGGLGGGGTGGNAGSNGGAATNETGSGGGGAGALGTGGLGGTGIIILRYNVSTLPPITNFTMSNTTGVAPVKVNFTDDSIDVTSWNWSFGDGNYSEAQYPNHTYTSGANYTVTLNASNIVGYNFTIQYVEVYSTPVTEFTSNTTSGISPLTVEFTDTSTGYPINWNWTFGGANFSDSQNPTYTFTGVGNYTVILNASNPAGWDNVTHYINVTPPPPTASFTMSPTTGGIPVTVAFTDTSTGTPTSWNWSFGDGMLSTDQNPSHTYANGTGTYTITLNASNIYGSNTTNSNFIATSHVYTADERITTKILDTQAFIVGGIYLAVGAVLVTLVAAIFGSKPQ